MALSYLTTLVLVAAVVDASEISPELHPKSDSKFFGKDYPEDTRPAVIKDLFGFKHPYPIVQETNQFDKDYVKDENGDGGEWKAQMDYDILRHKIPKQMEIVDKALKEEQGEEHGLDIAIDTEKVAEQSVEELKRQLEAAKKATAEANRKVEEAEKAAADAEKKAGDKAGEDGKETDAAKAEVDKDKAEADGAAKEAKDAKEGKGADGGAAGEGKAGEGKAGEGGDAGAAGGAGGEGDEAERERLLKECKEELVRAKLKLDKLKHEQAEHEKQLAAERDGLTYKKKEYDDSKIKAELDELNAKKPLEQLKKEHEAAQAAHDKAVKSVAEEKEDVRRTEADLATSAEELRSFRKAQAGHGGGIFNKPKPPPVVRSGAAMLYPSIAALAGLVFLGW